MKKRVIPFILALSMMMPVAAFGAAPTWHIDKTATVEPETEFTMANAPNFIIEASDNFRMDFDFEIKLINAHWLYSDAGSLEPGIDYIKVDDDIMWFLIDTDVFDATSEDIRVPLYSKVLGEGECKVEFVCTDYNIGSAEVVDFAGTPFIDNTTIKYNGEGKLYGEGDELGMITIEEWKAESIKKGDSYYLTLTNDFEFVETGKVSFTKDFEGAKTEYIFDEDEPDVVEIRFNNDIERPTGNIILTGLKVASTSKSDYKDTYIVITRDGKEKYSKELDIGRFVQTISSDAPLKISSVTMDRESIHINGTGGPGKKVKVFVGGRDIAETRVDTKGKWEIETEFDKKLADGLYLVETGYYSNSTGKFTSVIKTEVELYKEGITTIFFTLGENSYVKGSEVFEMDGSLFIDENNRMMVPLRALCNALDITDENIDWNDTLRCVTLIKGDITVKVYIGSNMLIVNDKSVEIDTEAVIKDGRTYLPLRGICEVLSVRSVDWDSATKTAIITK